MAAVTDKKTSAQKALLIASGPAMLEQMVRPLKDAGLAVNACENFIDAKHLYNRQSLVVLPLREDDQDEAKAFVEWLRRHGEPIPYVLGVGRCEAGQRKGLVAKMGLNDLITLPFDETRVQERLALFYRWAQAREPEPSTSSTGMEEAAPTASNSTTVPPQAIDPDLLQTTRVSLFAGAASPEEEESPETIYCRETPAGIAMFDRDMRYVLANPRWIQQFRLKNEDIIGRSQFDVFPKLHPNWRKIYQRCLNGETRRGRETVDAGQGPLEMRWEVRPWRYRAGQIGGVTIAFEEVWKPADEKRASSGGPSPATTPEGLALPMHQLAVPAQWTRLDGKVIEVSPAAREIGAIEPETAFLDALHDGLDALPLVQLSPHEDAATQAKGNLAWSHTTLRNAEGEPTGILRVGVFLPEALLAPSAAALEDTDPASLELESFDDDDLDQLSTLVWKTNKRGEITFFNAAWLDFRNRTLEKELNGGWLDGLHLADARSTKNVVAEAIREQRALEHGFRLRSGEGHFVDMEMWVRPFFEPGGELLGFYGACRPARLARGFRTPATSSTPRDSGWPQPQTVDPKLTQKLSEAEQEIASLRLALNEPRPSPFDQVPVMLWKSDAGGGMAEVSQEWERWRGRAAAEERGDGWLDGVSSEEERSRVREELRTAVQHQTSLTLRFPWTDSMHRQRLVELHGTPMRDADEEFLGLNGSLRDVTTEHQALTSLRECLAPGSAEDEHRPMAELLQELTTKLPAWQERQALASSDLESFREIFDHVATGIVLLGPDNKPIFANRRHRDLLGFGIEEAGDMEAWLSQSCNDQPHAQAVLKIWQEDIWRRQLTKVVALKNTKGSLRDIRIEPQLFLDDNRLLLTLQDVTEAQRSEEAMRDSEIRFRALFRESSMGIALIDSEEKIYDINPALEKVIGIPRRQLLCRQFDECVHPEDLPRKQALLQELLHSPKRSAQLELRLASLRGGEAALATEGEAEEIWVRLHISLVRDVDQRVLFTAYFVQDITEQKRVQAELLISQEQNRALLEIIPEVILLVDRSGEVIDLMPGESVPLKLPEHEAVGARIDTIIPAFRDSFASLIEEAYATEDVVPFAFSGADGGAFEARIVACKPDSAVITIQTSGAQRPSPAPMAPPTAAAPAIPASIRLQSLTFSHAPDAVVMTNSGGTILDWNPAAERLFGYSKEEAQGQPLPALFGVDSIDALTRHLEQGNGNRWSGELPFQRKDRSEGNAKVIFLPLKAESGEHAGQVAFIRTAEAARAHSVASAPPSDLRDQLPQIHQRLQNNLQIISTLLNLQYKSLSDGTAKAALLTGSTRTQALLLLHQHIGVSEGEEVVDFAPFTEALARELLSVYQAEERVEVHAEVDSVLDLQAASPLALILSELISNALRHGFPSPGEGNLHVWMRVKGGQGELRVRNDGIPESQTARNPSGMGLQIVKTLANQIGGSLEKIDTTETEFRVYFKTSLRD